MLRPPRPAAESTRWGIAASAAACAAVRALGVPAARVKWPNDVVVDGRKIAGILVEARTSGGTIGDLVVGLGLNVGHAARDFPPDLPMPATSLRMEGAPIPSLDAAAACWLEHLAPLHRALAEGRWEPVARAWLPLAPAASGARARFEGTGGTESGTTAGLDATGALRIRREDGSFWVVRDASSVVAWEP